MEQVARGLLKLIGFIFDAEHKVACVSDCTADW